ncbi:MAG: metallophosphoesterase [Proteobacteria bacterium]|nr:metallophosphoesterase [Pseudomonadota bacterium]
MPGVRVVAFVLAFSLLIAGLHGYVWARLARDTELSRPQRRWLAGVLTVLAASLPAALVGRWLLPQDAFAWLPTLAYVWLGYVFYLVLLLACADVARLLRRTHAKVLRGRDPAHADPEADPQRGRRVFVARATAVAASAGASLIGLSGANSAFDILAPEVTVRLQRFPRALDGFRIALLSDVHVGPTLRAAFLKGVVERTNRLRPDLIAITGDLVDGSVAQLGSIVEHLGALRSRYGVFFVTGNHEYYSGVEPWLAFLRRLGQRVLMNDRVSIGDGGASFDLAGIPDRQAHRYHRVAADAASAVEGRDPERELVLLAHQPIQVDQAQRVGAGLQLSGHTHGGQIFPFGAATRLVQPYLSGLHRHSATTQIYVSRGTGLWGPPMRVLAPAEITQIVLVDA